MPTVQLRHGPCHPPGRPEHRLRGSGDNPSSPAAAQPTSRPGRRQNITFNAKSLVSTGLGGAAGGAVRMLASATGYSATAITRGGVNAGTANVSLTATSGSILNGGPTTYSRQCGRGRPATGRGHRRRRWPAPLWSPALATLSASTGSGGIFVRNDGALAVGSVAVTVQVVGASAAAAPVTDASQSGLAATGAGAIVLQTVAGTLTLSSAVAASGSGNILLQAAGPGTSIAGGASVSSASGNITILGAGNVTFSAADNIATGGGTIDVESGTGSITYDPNSLVSTVLGGAGGNDVRMLAGMNITLGAVTAGTATVSLTATSGTIANGENSTFYPYNVTAATSPAARGRHGRGPGCHPPAGPGSPRSRLWPASGGIFLTNDGGRHGRRGFGHRPSGRTPPPSPLRWARPPMAPLRACPPLPTAPSSCRPSTARSPSPARSRPTARATSWSRPRARATACRAMPRSAPARATSRSSARKEHRFCRRRQCPDRRRHDRYRGGHGRHAWPSTPTPWFRRSWAARPAAAVRLLAAVGTP